MDRDMPKHARLRIILPVVLLIVTLSLSLVGRTQTIQRARSGAPLWDYLAPAEVILHSINYPAAVAAGLTAARRTFQIGVEYSLGVFILYVFYVILLWFGLGWCLDTLWSRRQLPRVPVPIIAVGIVGGLLLLLAAIGTMEGPSALLLVCSAFFWSAIFLVIPPATLIWQHRRAISKPVAQR